MNIQLLLSKLCEMVLSGCEDGVKGTDSKCVLEGRAVQIRISDVGK